MRGIFYRCAITSALRRTILCLANIRHQSEQPNTCGDQDDKKAEHHSVFNAAMAFTFGRFGLGHLFRWRIKVHVAAVIHDAIPPVVSVFTRL